jgi:hypothetical protein
MRLPKEEYKKAEGCLKRYNYNYITIINIRADIMSLGAMNLDGMPKAKYSNADSVVNSVIELQENEELQLAIKEYKAVVQAYQLVKEDSKYIFEEFYKKGTSKWDIISSGMSERTFFRRKRDLVFAVSKELKRLEKLQ